MLSAFEERPTPMEDNELELPSNCKVADILSSLESFKTTKRKLLTAQKNELCLTMAPTTLFHTLQAKVKQNNWAVGRRETESSALVPKSRHKPLYAPSKWKRKVTPPPKPARVVPPRLHVRYPKRLLPKCEWRKQDEHGLGYGPPGLTVIPYMLLSKTVSPSQTFASAEEKCDTGEILCKLLHFAAQDECEISPETLMCTQKDEERPLSPGAAVVHFKDLKDLQWRLYKGIIKRREGAALISRHSKQLCALGWTGKVGKSGQSPLFVPLIDLEKARLRSLVNLSCDCPKTSGLLMKCLAKSNLFCISKIKIPFKNIS